MSLTDGVDLALVTVVVYLALRWLAASLSRRALLALGFALALYATSRAAGLFLTERLLRLGSSVLALALLVAFQEDVRRGFERLAQWTRTRRNLADGTVDCVVEAAVRLADARVGALLVLPGRQGLESHLRGGFALQGAISVPLLCSIFNTDTPGHDGAVIVHGSRIDRFGVHLPLSRHVDDLRERGTRHTAGLGLSERTDALVVIVSEERGAISVAENGQLEELTSPEALRARLRSHGERSGRASNGRALWRWWPAHLGLKAAAAAIVAGWWLLTPPSTTVQRVFPVPVQYVNLPPDTVLAEPNVSQAEVTLAGPDRAFGMVSPDELRLSVDLSQLDDAAESAVLTHRHLAGHGSLEVVRIVPDMVPLATVRLRAVALPVEVRFRGDPPSGMTVLAAEAIPSVVQVLVPPGEAEAQAVETEPVDLSQLAGSGDLSASLTLPPGARWPDGAVDAGRVRVRVVLTRL